MLSSPFISPMPPQRTRRLSGKLPICLRIQRRLSLVRLFAAVVLAGEQNTRADRFYAWETFLDTLVVQGSKANELWQAVAVVWKAKLPGQRMEQGLDRQPAAAEVKAAGVEHPV